MEVEKDAVELYAAANEAHYRTKRLEEALELYRGVVTSHPDTQEADHSLTQIQSIVRSVVPAPALLEALISLVRVHLEAEAATGVETTDGGAR